VARYKIHPAAVVRLRQRYALGRVSMYALARQYGLSESQVGRILRGESRKQAAGPTTGRQMRHTPKGETNGRSKLTSQEVRRARARYDRGGVTQADLAEAYGLTRVGMHLVLKRRSWRHIP